MEWLSPLVRVARGGCRAHGSTSTVRPVTADGGGLQRPHSRVTAEAELASRVRAVVEARRAPGLVVVVEGPPGIGKSHLLHRLCAEPARGALVRSARGDERLAQQGFAVVEELVGGAPAGDHPADHAFARVDDWCQAGPVLLCVDDAHQLDAASVGVLRRLAVQRVLGWLAARLVA